MKKLEMKLEVYFNYYTDTIELLRLPNSWCFGNEPNYALYNKGIKKWFVPSRPFSVGNRRTRRSRPYWSPLPGRLCNIPPSRTRNCDEENKEEEEAEEEHEEEEEEHEDEEEQDDDDRTVEMDQDQDLEDDSDPDEIHDATHFSYWYLVTAECHQRVLDYLDGLEIADGRKSSMDEWGIFKYE